MTEIKDDGGPFHPFVGFNDGFNYPGATFREVAAIHAMAAMLVCENDWSPQQIATLSVECADALIAELKK